MSNQRLSSYIGCRSSTELHTSCVCSCTTSTSDRHHNTCQTVCPQLLKPVADTGWGRLAQRLTFCQEQELDLENMVSSTPVQPPGTLFHPNFMTSLTLVLSENDSRMYFLIVLITDYCWRSWTCRIAAPYKFFIDWLIDLALRSELSFGHFTLNVRTVRIYPTSAKVSLVRTVLGPKCLVPFGRHLMAYLFSCLN